VTGTAMQIGKLGVRLIAARLAARTATAIALSVSFLSVVSLAAEREQNTSGLDVPITLEISVFERLQDTPLNGGGSQIESAGRDARAASVRLALPGILAGALAGYPHVQIVAVAGRSAVPEGGQATAAPQAEFTVRGVVTVRGREVIINSAVYNRTTNKSRRLNATRVRIDRLNTDIDPLAFVIAAEIATQKKIVFKTHSTVAACMRESASSKPSDLERAVRRDMAGLVRSLTLESLGNRINWTTAGKKECSPPINLEELAKTAHADAIILLTLQSVAKRSSAGRAVVKWEIYITEEKKRIPMPDIALDVANPILDDDGLAGQVATLFAAIMSITGDWRTSEIPAAEAKASTYLEYGKQSLSKGDQAPARLAALQDYFFTMAVARAGELTKSEASEAKLYLARVRLAQGRNKEAAILLDEAAAQDEGNFDVLLARADLSFRRGQQEDASQKYEEIIREFPTRVEGYERLAAALTLQNKDEAAAQVYRRLVAVNPESSFVGYRGLAETSLQKGSWRTKETWTEAASLLQDGIGKLKDQTQQAQLQKELATLYADAAQASFVSKQYQDSLEFLKQALAIMPTLTTHMSLGNTYSALGDLEGAVREYSAVVSLTERDNTPAMTPEYIGSRLAVLEILTLQKKYDDAIKWGEETLRRFTANKDAMTFEPVALWPVF
jgi:tetratricopeptide (TPR) repeat protein